MFSFNRRPSTWTEPAPPAPTPPSTAMLIENGEADRGVFGSFGEMLSPTPDSAVVVEPGPPLLIEPPPWAGQEADLAIGAPPMSDQPSELGALAQMKLNSGDVDWPEPPGPAMVTAPLTRPQIPEVDWRQEERERLAKPEAPSEELPRRYPPPARETP